MTLLAVETGIPPSTWADEGERAISTAIEIINRKYKQGGSSSKSGPQMSG